MKKRSWFAVLLCTYGIGRYLGRYLHSAGQRRGYRERRTDFLYRVTKAPLRKVRIYDRDYGEEATELQGEAA